MADYIEREKAIANSRDYNLGGSYDNTERAVPVDAINSIPAAEGGMSMGVYIKDMEMPKDEEMLCINIYPDGKVCINLDLECTQIATAVSVPPHGRLGDLDEINEKHDKLSRDFCHGYFKNTWDFVCAARKIFYDAPTIIPAEEGE